MRFALRTLLIVVTLIGVLLMPLVLHLRANRHEEKVAESLERFPGMIYFHEDESILPTRRLQTLCLGANEFNDDDIRQVCSLRRLDSLSIGGAQIDDDSWRMLARLQYLTDLDLRRTTISDDGMQYVGQLQNLQYLTLYETNVSDDSIPYLVQLVNLTKLGIKKTRITAEGFEKLQAKLPDCEIDYQAAADLRAAE